MRPKAGPVSTALTVLTVLTVMIVLPVLPALTETALPVAEKIPWTFLPIRLP